MSLNVTSSISQAVAFVTRPISFVQDAYVMFAIQTVLRSTLLAAFAACSDKRLIMTFTPAMPPRPVWAACIATGTQWRQWIQFFGQQEFDLVIEETSVVARYHGSGETLTIWSAPRLNDTKVSLLAKLSASDVARIPIRKLGRPVATRPADVLLPVAPLRSGPQRTLAQQLIDSDGVSDADELFAMISKTSIVSPTPTRAHFHIPTILSPVSSPEPSESSRPSSRTSTRSSCFSDDRLSSASTSTSVSLGYIDVEQPHPEVYVDRNKKDKTKYLYQGGVSSTLTGGVMLGRPSKPVQGSAIPLQKLAFVAPKTTVQYQNKCRARATGRHGATQLATGANPSWRRASAATPIGTGCLRRF